ncbi:protein rolling stone-like isoform X3 [Zootermopsis nevadensis]|uniref:protein rolling stone-like isoform X3 n=1 Tax=Zootermopsis nevadensis TaxID=136037 RepID=UPI000B8ECF18|nr:protein rolling stone-like isoform X3 [Zootermopsis nevadensis]
MKTILRQEINIRCLGFSHDRPEQFVRCQWQKNDGVSIIYLVYRWIFGILFLSVWIWSFFSAAQQNTPTENFLSKWPIYLTNWGYTLCTAQALLAAGLVTQQLVKERKTAVHNLTALNLLMHAFNSILMVLDIILVAHPFRLIHFCWSLLFIFVYFCFSVIYHLAGGTGKNNAPSIYPALDWSKVESTLPIAILGMLAVILAHFCTWLAVIARNRIARSKDDKSEEPKISKLSSNQVQPMDVVMS